MNPKNQIILADVNDGLNFLTNESIDCAITSPPYWQQRDYEFDGQIGNEKNLTDYISILNKTFLILKKKLKPEGIFFLNIGDKYISKYGYSPLGFIPYKLAYLMVQSGWNLEDILIWYKPNHMPSSIKNRFTNTYEPVFVFSKEKNNYYKEFVNSRISKRKNSFNKILKIPTQPTPYEHMAVYPEKLVETLLSFGIPQNGIILDPFAGSGTTGKAVLNLNETFIHNSNYFFILIEANEKYIEIIKQRCNLKDDAIIDLSKSKPLAYKFETNKKFLLGQEKFGIDTIYKNDNISFIEKKNNSNNHSIEYVDKKGMIKIFEKKIDFLSFIENLISGKTKIIINDNGIFYLGIKSYDIEVFEQTSKLNENGWIIRNVVIVPIKNSWYPIFFIVKDTKKVTYYFNLDAIRIKPKINNNIFTDEHFINLKVIDNLFSQKLEGKVLEVISHYKDNFPNFILVKWNDKSITKEYVLHNEDTNNYLTFYCPKCKSKLENYYEPNEVNCANCSLKLWTSKNTIPILIENLPSDFDDIDLQNEISRISYKEKFLIYDKINKNGYNGKFKDALKINKGASPGARNSTEEKYFSMQRFYDVKQALIADYLNIKRVQKHYSKKEFTNLFSSSYKHTVGHWLRKDLGGSIPSPTDWELISKFLNIDESFTNYINRKALRLQIVKPHHKGKNPGDFLERKEEEIIQLLKSTFTD
ncbi:MAG: hypothetical protein STSR0008_07090 [Ignavibacterium sp.]